MNYCEKIRQSMIDGDDDSVVKYIKKSLLSGYDPKYILKNILIDALSLIAKKEERNQFELDKGREKIMKKAAKSVGEKSVAMLHVKDINAITGYVRGGCTPIGMKKLFPTYIQESAKDYDKIYVSGGRIGYTLKLNPQDLAKLVRGKFADFIVK
mgnify:CR=1 FL=1